MKRIAIAQVPALFVLLIAAVLAGVASAQQAPPIPTSPQARNMLPDTMAAFADRSATAANTSQARNMLPDTIAAFAARSATVANTSQAGYLLPEVTFADRSATAANLPQAEYLLPEVTFAARSTTAAIMPQAEYLLPDVTFVSRSATVADTPLAGDMIPDVIAAGLTLPTLHQADGPTQESQTAQLAPSQYDEKAAVMRDMVQAIRAVRDAQTAQLAPSHFDDSIEAPQVAAAMRAMAAIHVPSMEAIRLALASAKAATEEKSQEARLQDPTLATPAQTAQLTSSHYAALGALTSAQARALGLPALASAKAAAEAKAQGSQNAQLASSHYAALGALTSAQARALGLPALAGIKEVAEERYLTAILQNPTLLALVQAEEASQSQHVGLTVGELARLASAESQHEATESPIEVAFEAAEAAHNPGVSMLQVLP